MDNFDDLLAPSRSAFDSNPFANGFEQHTDSADPWASPFASHSNDGFGTGSSNLYDDNPFSGESSADPYAHAPFAPAPVLDLNATSPASEDDEVSERVDTNREIEKETRLEKDIETKGDTPVADQVADNTASKAPPADPLDLANAVLDDDEDERPLGTLRLPGFRESVATPRAAAPSTLLSDGLDSAPRTPIADSSEQRFPVAPPSAVQAQHLQQSAATSPIDDHPTASSLERSLGGLSLGYDVLGAGLTSNASSSRAVGWQPADSDTMGDWGRTDLPPAPATPMPPQVDDGSDDDKPIGQALKRQSQESTRNAQKPDDNGLQPIFVITVDDPQKVGDPMRPYIMYTVHTRTTSPQFQKSAFSVLRRYSDFVWLYETLCFTNPGVVVPPVPEKSPFGRFEDHFVKQRRLGLEKCIQKMANHPVLGKDSDLRMFLESDTFALDIKHRKTEAPHENKGLFASIGQTLAGPRFHETDEWFDKQKGYLDGLESQLRGLAKAIELVARHRTDLATATGEFSQSVTELSACEVGKQLSHALSELAEVERKAQDLQIAQSEEDLSTLMATVDEYARLINSVRAAFTSRIRIYYAWKQSESDLLRTKQTHEKNRAQGKIPSERLGQSLSQIAEAERRALEAKREYEHVSRLVKSEVGRFETERIEDFKDTLHAFLEGMISRQKELISCWENYQQMLLKRIAGGPSASAVRAAEVA